MDLGGSWNDRLPLVEFAYNNIYHSSIEMAPYEALYERKCRFPLCWDEFGEREFTGPEIVQDAAEKVALIKRRLKTAASRQKSYADPKRRDVEFQVSNYVSLKVSPIKGVMRFGKKEKLAPRYIGPFEILERIGMVAYRLAIGFTSGYVTSTSSIPCLDAEKVYFRSFTCVATSEHGSKRRPDV